ncbi:SHOCT domain-containing protein [Defluviimonas sp. WL0002]|uniref:SHOCT domain-containing protein n=1 Tax=Albidovulum marisflavi TaxID=2984159 RepID=A0ABT2ZCA2_9RHOB|nr:SHOCT domain-containing protein [Defluviimonas sp. WL0002]MCV2868734.1 SHOCT domain-containing protein [Defluviimonas sp. WL0002]
MFRLALLSALLAMPAFADPGEYGHMMDWGYGYGFGMMFGPVIWIIVLGLVVVGVVWVFRQHDSGFKAGGKPDALSELDMRLAKGDIDPEDYAARKKLLGG